MDHCGGPSILPLVLHFCTQPGHEENPLPYNQRRRITSILIDDNIQPTALADFFGGPSGKL